MPVRRTTPPARGERAAIIGYRAQYRAATALILGRLTAGTLDSIRLADPEAGKLDDLQIISGGNLDAYQFKWSLHPGSFTFRDFNQGESGQPALIASIFASWKALQAHYLECHVVPHLISNDYPSTSDTVPELEDAPAPRYFAAFLSEAWEPLQRGELSQLPSKWVKAGEHLRKTAGASSQEWKTFVKVWKIGLRSTLGELPAHSQTARQKAAWEEDVKLLTEQLFALVASQAGTVEFTRAELLRTLGWSDESVPRHTHDFPIDDRVYEPIDATIQRLRTALGRHQGGYLCLSGPPGAGKSSLLTQTLRTYNDNVLRYYAFVPSQKGRDIFLGERGEAANFLHDLSSELNRLGLTRQPLGPHHFDIHLLRARFEEQLAELAANYRENRRRTLILVDGLDHIGREQTIGHSLLLELPSPDRLPEGVLFVLGTQTPDILPDAVERHIRRDERHISIEPLSASAVRRVLRRSGSGEGLDDAQMEECVVKIGGHPLALGMLVNTLRDATGAEEINHVLANFERYEGDIIQFYDKYWSPLRQRGDSVLDALGLLARVGPDIDLAWVESWLEPHTLRAVRQHFHQFFRRNEIARRWSFFHNSFRLFVRQLTAEVIPGEFDHAADRHFFHRLAEHAAASPSDSYWRGEEVFYRAQAGEDQAVLALVTPERARTQFHSLRPEREISEHLVLAREALIRHPSLLGIIRLGLVERELRARSESFGLERDTFYSVLLASGRYNLLFTHLREGSRLVVDSATALQLCQEMWSLDLREEARSLFDLVDPRQDSHHFAAFDHLQGQQQVLLAWLLAGVEIIGVSGCVEVLHSYEFESESADLHRHHPGSSTPIDQEAERHRVLVDGVMALYARGRWSLAAELRAAFEGGAGDSEIQTEYEFSRVEESLNNGEPERAKDYLHEMVPQFSSQDPLEKWRLAEACARAGLYTEAEELARATPAPPLDAVSTMHLGGSRSAVTPLQYHRLRYACGETLAPARLVPSDPLPQSAGLVLFSRATCVVARLWGKAWRDEPVTVEEFRREAGDLLASLNRRFDDRIQWRGLYSDLSRDRLIVYSALIEAGKAHGPAVIEALTEIFASEWLHPSRRVHWITYVKRDVCLDLAKAGASHGWVVQWLECCEQETARPENANSQASEYSAQARAWLQVGEVDRAVAMMFASARSSPGMTHSRDDQLKWWVSLLGEHWAKNPVADLDHARQPPSPSGQSRLANELSLSPETVRAFIRHFEEDEHGNIAFPHGKHGDAEVYGQAGYFFRGVEESGAGRGRSIWHGRPLRHQPATLILVAPFVGDALAAWQEIGDPHIQAHVILVSTAGQISQTGIDSLKKLVGHVHGVQCIRGRGDLVMLADLNGTGMDEVAGQSETLAGLAQTLGIKHLRHAPPEGTTWSEYFRLRKANEEQFSKSDEGSTEPNGEAIPPGGSHLEDEDALQDVHDDGFSHAEDGEAQQSGQERSTPRSPRFPRR